MIFLKKSGLVEGAFAATLAIILTKVIGVLYVVPFYKIVGEKGGALYGYAYNIYNLFLIISSAGIPLAISKITSEYNTLNQKREKDYMLYFARKLVIIISVVSFLILFFSSNAIASLIIGNMTGGNTIKEVSFVIKAVSFAILIVPFLSIFRGFLQGHKYIIASSNSQVIEQVVRIIIIVVGSFVFVKVLNLDIYLAVAVSVFGATVGAFFSYIYLKIKSKKILKIKNPHVDADMKKSVRDKLIAYSLPFIAVNLSYSLYNTVDMVLLIKGLNMIGFNATDIETISSIFTTWAHKILSIVIAVATGLVISLIPNMVSSFTKSDKKDVNLQYQKALDILILIILPLSIFISIYSKEIWNIFYGASEFGPKILSFAALVAFLDSLYIIMGSILQNLNKNKLIYLSIILGLVLNAVLDIPLILLFNKIGLYPYYGAIFATVIGYSSSLYIVTRKLKQEEGLRYNSTFILKNLSFSLIVLVPLNLIIKNYLPLELSSRFNTLIYLSIVGLISLVIFYIINKDLIKKVFGKDFLRKIVNFVK